MFSKDKSTRPDEIDVLGDMYIKDEDIPNYQEKKYGQTSTFLSSTIKEQFFQSATDVIHSGDDEIATREDAFKFYKLHPRKFIEELRKYDPKDQRDFVEKLLSLDQDPKQYEEKKKIATAKQRKEDKAFAKKVSSILSILHN